MTKRSFNTLITDMRVLCKDKDVDDVFLAAFALLLSSVHQRTDNKEDALRMLDYVAAGMKEAMETDYDRACEEVTYGAHTQH